MLSIGMYVSCPINKNGIELHVLGKIIKYNKTTGEIEVCFYDWKNKDFVLQILNEKHRKYFSYEVRRASCICSISAKWGYIDVNIICEFDRDDQDLKRYVCKYRKNGKKVYSIISESALDIDFYNIKNTAYEEAYRFRNTDIRLFFVRRFLSARRARMDSFEKIIFSLVNTRVYLYPHQMDTVVKAIRGNRTRVMLADEVGLGKTIEALTILKYYQRRNHNFHCLIVVPESLEYQWFNEVKERFGIEVEIFSYTKVKYKKTKATTFILSYGDFYKYKYDIEEMKWDMLIIDEVHKILGGPYYPVLFTASIKIRNVILLSATPITRAGEEYLQLMKMVNPSQYKLVDIDKFKSMVEIQEKVTRKLLDMNVDLGFYDEIDMRDSFIMNLDELNEELQDQYIEKIIGALSNESEDKGLYVVKLAMEYLRKQYVIETNVIRHRREEVKEANIQRKLIKTFTYNMEGGDLEIYESDVYNSLLILTQKYMDKSNVGVLIKAMEAMLSSPYALLPYLSKLQIKGDEKQECLASLKKWTKFCDAEIKRLIQGNHITNTRFSCLIDAIESCNADKILIFSSFKETVNVLDRLIKGRYGEDSSVMFDSEMSRLETQLAARKFQNDEKCRFIICDKSGGEGRNFQKAEVIIHFDMSWSPAMMEQRIGRLDRIGRDIERDVNSIVIYSNVVIEKEIYEILNDSLNVFEKSLSGLEIIFDKLQRKIANAYLNDPEFGLEHSRDSISKSVNDMRENVENEIYASQYKEDDEKELDYIKEISEAFEAGIEKETEKNILYWINKSGVVAAKDKNTEVVTVNCLDAAPIVLQVDLFYEAFKLGEKQGTFRRAYAIEHDSVEYFSPSHYLYRTFMNQMDRKQRGRFLAVSMKDEARWAGFVFVWNIEIDETLLLKGGIDPQTCHYLKKYLNEQQIINTEKVYGEDDYDEQDIVHALDYRKMKLIDNLEDTISYDLVYDEDSWERCIDNALENASIRAKRTADSWLRIKELTNTLSKDRMNLEIEKKTVCHHYKQQIIKEKAMKDAVVNCYPIIDSILYVEI